jgi:hypothetical protein
MKRLILVGLACVLLSTSANSAEIDMVCKGPLRGDAVTYNRVGYCDTIRVLWDSDNQSHSFYSPPEVNEAILNGCRYYHPCVVHARVSMPEGEGNAMILHVYSVHPGK